MLSTKRLFRTAVFLVAIICGFFLLAQHASAATLYVDSTTGDDITGDGTEGSPYATFHKGYTESSDGDTLNLTGTFSWTDADETGDSSTSGYTIDKNLTIEGQGAASTIIQAAESDNSANRRVFTIPLNREVTIRNLQIRYGRTTGDGGGVQVNGHLITDGVDVFSNRATGSSGGGIDVRGSALIQNSSIRNNIADNMGGGVNRHFYAGDGSSIPGSEDTLDIVNSTISGNTVTASFAYLEGGGVFFRRGGGSITNSTITNNQVTNGGTGKSTHGIGSDDPGVEVLLKNNIIAGNILSTSGGDIGHRSSSRGTFTDNGGNIIGRPGTNSQGYTAASTSWLDAVNSGTAIDGTFVLQDGVGATSGSLDLDDTLAINSNTVNETLTHDFTSDTSIAIENAVSGDNGDISLPTTDQRGVSRPAPATIGAFEASDPDETAPTVDGLSPADDATNVSAVSNLVITFDESVDVETGNIVIYNTSDDSVFETIDVTSDKVTGTGTTEITINPENVFAPNASYYIQIDATAFDDTSGNSFAGISNVATWNFTISDVSETSRITTSPTSVTMDENDTTLVVEFSLSEPIIIPGGGENGLTIFMSSSNTAEFTVSPASVSWENSEWADTRTVTLTSVNDDDTGDDAASLYWVVETDSEFYAGISSSTSITLVDDDAVEESGSSSGTYIRSSVTREYIQELFRRNRAGEDIRGFSQEKWEAEQQNTALNNAPAMQIPQTEAVDQISENGSQNSVSQTNKPPLLPNVWLMRGNQGQEVSNVQTILAGYGYTIDIDGAFGPQTERVIKLFQESNNLTVDGIVGPETRRFLLK